MAEAFLAEAISMGGSRPDGFGEQADAVSGVPISHRRSLPTQYSYQIARYAAHEGERYTGAKRRSARRPARHEPCAHGLVLGE
jgi:hypothetical protein